MTMSEREKRAWSWAGKIALVALPAAISGFASFKKSQVEAEAQGAAAYTALRLAFEAQQKQLEETKHQVSALEGEMRVVRDALSPAVEPIQPTLPLSAVTAADAGMPVASVDAGTPDTSADGDNIPEALAEVRRRAKAIFLPKSYDDMVRQYTPKK